jgi:hypothetical protein
MAPFIAAIERMNEAVVNRKRINLALTERQNPDTCGAYRGFRASSTTPSAQHGGGLAQRARHSSSGSGYCSGASPIALISLGYLTPGSLRF